DHALKLNFDSIEIYSNLLFLSSELKQQIIENNILVATSLYSYDENTHDKITQGISSWRRTVKNLKYLAEAGVSIRVSFVEMIENEGHFDNTKEFLEGIGISNLDYDKVRKFGRELQESTPEMS